MLPYTFEQIVFFFLFYCFVGWCFESTYTSIKSGKLTNRGFMRGPFIPIYGCGAMMLLFSASWFLKWPVAVFFAGMISCSILEYVTGWGMEKIFKVRYWDYSQNPLNLNGHICLGASAFWGVAALLLNYLLHKPVEKMCLALPSIALHIITIGVSIYFVVDLTLAFKAAFDIRSFIIKIEEAKEEMYLMSRRLDVMLAVLSDEYDKRTQAISDTIDDISNGIDEKLAIVKNALETKPSEITDNIRNEYFELKAKLNISKAEKKAGSFARDLYRKATIKGNPSMKSSMFSDAFETLKKGVMEVTKSDKEEKRKGKSA
ncbi:MAG: hypothetical protein MJ123_10875 [Lachnospiraceae bacterium]|nr:hypothetical protein [Lachnospiraceae bacterium]